MFFCDGNREGAAILLQRYNCFVSCASYRSSFERDVRTCRIANQCELPKGAAHWTKAPACRHPPMFGIRNTDVGTKSITSQNADLWINIAKFVAPCSRPSKVATLKLKEPMVTGNFDVYDQNCVWQRVDGDLQTKVDTHNRAANTWSVPPDSRIEAYPGGHSAQPSAAADRTHSDTSRETKQRKHEREKRVRGHTRPHISSCATWADKSCSHSPGPSTTIPASGAD